MYLKVKIKEYKVPKKNFFKNIQLNTTKLNGTFNTTKLLWKKPCIKTNNNIKNEFLKKFIYNKQ